MAHVFNHAMLYVSLGLIEKEQHLDFFWFYAISYVHERLFKSRITEYIAV